MCRHFREEPQLHGVHPDDDNGGAILYDEQNKSHHGSAQR